MKSYLLVTVLLSALGAWSCSRSDQAEARRKAEEAQRKTEQAAQRAERELKKAGQSVAAAARNAGRQVENATQRGANDTVVDGAHARQKAAALSEKATDAALVTKVKSALAADVGLSTVTNVSVDVTERIATLKGTVHSSADRARAEHVALSVKGIDKVINRLDVQPE